MKERERNKVNENNRTMGNMSNTVRERERENVLRVRREREIEIESVRERERDKDERARIVLLKNIPKQQL